MQTRILFVKAHVKGHVKKDGTVVRPYVTKKPTAVPHGTGPGQFSLFSGAAPVKKEPPKGAMPHPKKNDDGHEVTINYPSKPTAAETWTDPDAVATFLPHGAVPEALYGVPFAPWEDHPRSIEEWADVPGQADLDEPPMPAVAGKHVSAGVVVEEPDGRVWVAHPTNAFGGYRSTFPKGTQDDGLSLQATAIKEAFEESGLQVEITDYLTDVERTTSVGRYYLARRVGGTPSACGWESQAVSLVPKDQLYSLLNRDTDHPIAEAVGAGPVPEKPAPGKLF